MGPFYEEIETSSWCGSWPRCLIGPYAKVIHIQGKDEQLVPIIQDLFGADLNVIKQSFNR